MLIEAWCKSPKSSISTITSDDHLAREKVKRDSVLPYKRDVLLLISLAEGFARGSRAAVSFSGLDSLCHRARFVHNRSPRCFCGRLGAISAQSCNLDWQRIAYNQPKKLFWTAQKTTNGVICGKSQMSSPTGKKANAHTQHSFDQSRWQQLCRR